MGNSSNGVQQLGDAALHGLGSSAILSRAEPGKGDRQHSQLASLCQAAGREGKGQEREHFRGHLHSCSRVTLSSLGRTQ